MSSLSVLAPEWFAAAFAATNAVRALFYIPQIIAIARSVDGARDISLSTWWMWTVNNALGALYTGVTMNHQALALSFWASAAACVGTIALTLRARKRHSLATEIST
jgi:predicted MFS family arabinose efflux permease